MEKIDIKSLTRELKGKVSDAAPKQPAEKDEKPITKKKTDKMPEEYPNDLDTIISTINQRDDFDTGGCVYIDSDIHDVLRRVKTRTKLRIGHLISWLIEDFVLEHREEIVEILKHKTNRFIDK